MVLIGVDPHKGSHKAVIVDGDEHEVARLTVRADRRQLQRLLGFAAAFGERTWAIESAGGLGFLLMPIFIFDPAHRNLYFGLAGLVLYQLLVAFSIRFYRVRRGERLADASPRRQSPWK